MKKTITVFALCAILIAACHKTQVPPPPATGQPSMAGQWNISTVNTYFYDAAGLRDSVHNYPGQGDNYYYRFRFNADLSWVELYASVPQGPFQASSGGTYTITSDSTFTLFNPDAITNTMTEPCAILSLTNNVFIFSKQAPTLFNGTDPGYIKYVFRLIK